MNDELKRIMAKYRLSAFFIAELLMVHHSTVSGWRVESGKARRVMHDKYRAPLAVIDASLDKLKLDVMTAINRERR